MQWLSIYGDSKSSLSEILLDSWERFMNLFLCCWLKVWVLLIKLPQGWSRSPRRCPVWPPHPAGVHGGLRVLQQLAPKVLRQLVFPSTWPFPLTLFFFISLLFFHLAFLFATTSCHPHSLRDFPTFPMLFVSFLFQTSGTLNKRQSCLYTCLCFVTFFQPLSPACFLLHQLVPLSRVTAEKRDRKERGHGNREQKQERKEGRVQALK